MIHILFSLERKERKLRSFISFSFDAIISKNPTPCDQTEENSNFWPIHSRQDLIPNTISLHVQMIASYQIGSFHGKRTNWKHTPSQYIIILRVCNPSIP